VAREAAEPEGRTKDEKRRKKLSLRRWAERDRGRNSFHARRPKSKRRGSRDQRRTSDVGEGQV